VVVARGGSAKAATAAEMAANVKKMAAGKVSAAAMAKAVSAYLAETEKASITSAENKNHQWRYHRGIAWNGHQARSIAYGAHHIATARHQR